MRMPMPTILSPALSHQSVRDEMKEGVTEKPAGSEAEEDLEQTLLLFTVVQGNEEKDEEWSSADEQGGPDGVQPDRRFGLHFNLLFFIVPVGVHLLPHLLPLLR